MSPRARRRRRSVRARFAAATPGGGDRPSSPTRPSGSAPVKGILGGHAMTGKAAKPGAGRPRPWPERAGAPVGLAQAWSAFGRRLVALLARAARRCLRCACRRLGGGDRPWPLPGHGRGRQHMFWKRLILAASTVMLVAGSVTVAGMGTANACIADADGDCYLHVT